MIKKNKEIASMATTLNGKKKTKNKFSQFKGLSLQERVSTQIQSGKSLYVHSTQTKKLTPNSRKKRLLKTEERIRKKAKRTSADSVVKHELKQKLPGTKIQTSEKSGIKDKRSQTLKKIRTEKVAKSRLDRKSDSETMKCIQVSASTKKKPEKEVKVKKKRKLKTKPQTTLETGTGPEQLSRHSPAVEASSSNQIQTETANSKKLGSSKKETGQTLSLAQKMKEKLKSSRFRYINEQLYTSDGSSAEKIFQEDPSAFQIYHEGFSNQMQKWPENPLNRIISKLKKCPLTDIVADMGCGDAMLAQKLKQKVHSFDLVALNDRVTVCEMSKTPLGDETVDHCVFCLSLMGTNLADYLREANRIMKKNGTLHIAEIRSRVLSPRDFQRGLEKLGFVLVRNREVTEFFIYFEFQKISKPKNRKPPGLFLKPCVYKKR